MFVWGHLGLRCWWCFLSPSGLIWGIKWSLIFCFHFLWIWWLCVCGFCFLCYFCRFGITFTIPASMASLLITVTSLGVFVCGFVVGRELCHLALGSPLHCRTLRLCLLLFSLTMQCVRLLFCPSILSPRCNTRGQAHLKSCLCCKRCHAPQLFFHISTPELDSLSVLVLICVRLTA
jgi:hypothetical protein